GCILIASAAGLRAADEGAFPGVEKLMSAEEYRAAGLDKLTAAERAALNRWLIGYTIGEAPVIRDKNPEVKKADREQRISARVTGTFKGWSGDTVFRLDNGQVWQQRLDSRFPYNGDEREVVIDRNFLGFYRMTHVASGRAVGVTRID
ncbi:MAG: hypothetical protein RIC38_11960, partial [Chromatocurvus sp.]